MYLEQNADIFVGVISNFIICAIAVSVFKNATLGQLDCV